MQESSYLDGHDEYIANLRRMPVFNSLDDGQLRTILSLSRLHKYERGETIISEGAFDCWLYFIISGSVQVEKGGRRVGDIRGSGSVFGEMGILGARERSATVRALSEAMCLAVDASFLDRLDGEARSTCYAVFYRMFVDILAERLRQTTGELAAAREELDGFRRRAKGGD